MKSFDIYILIASSIEMKNNSSVEINSWVQNEVSKLLTNINALEHANISIISFDFELNELVPLTNIGEFKLPIMVFWIVSDNVFEKLLNSRIKELLYILKEKISGSVVIKTQDLNKFSLYDYNSWLGNYYSRGLSLKIQKDTFNTFIDEKYETYKKNIIAV